MNATPGLRQRLLLAIALVLAAQFMVLATLFVFEEIEDIRASTSFYLNRLLDTEVAHFEQEASKFEGMARSRLQHFNAPAAALRPRQFSAPAFEAGTVASFLLSPLPSGELRVTRLKRPEQDVPTAETVGPMAPEYTRLQDLGRRVVATGLQSGWHKPLLSASAGWQLPYHIRLATNRILVMLVPAGIFFPGQEYCHDAGGLPSFATDSGAAATGAGKDWQLAVLSTYTHQGSGNSGAAPLERYCPRVVAAVEPNRWGAMNWRHIISGAPDITAYAPTTVPGLVLGHTFATAGLELELRYYIFVLLLLVAGTSGLLLLAAMLAAGRLARCLTGIYAGAEAISRGGLGGRLSEQQPYRELEQFTKVVNGLVGSLQEQVDKRREEAVKSAALEREVAIAGRIQQELLTKCDVDAIRRRYALDIGAFLAPAKQVAGDFYCVLARPDNRLLVAIGDVSGKGISAALVANDCVNLLEANGRQLALGELLQLVNSTLYERYAEQSMFATLFCCLLDPRAGELVHCDAGHEIPLLCRRGEAGIGRLPVARNMALGFMPDTRYETRAQRLHDDDCLLLYTDGLDGGIEQLRRSSALPLGVTLLGNRVLKNVELQTLLRCIHQQALARQGGEPFDDITLAGITMRKSRYRSFCLPARADAAGAGISRLRELCNGHNVAAECGNRLSIVLDEWVSNLVKYAEVDSDIIVSCCCSTSEVAMEIVAHCNNPSDPLARPELDVAEQLQSETPGGFGVHVIRNLTDALGYDTEDGWARLEARVKR